MEKPMMLGDAPTSQARGLEDLRTILHIIENVSELNRVAGQLQDAITTLQVERKAVGTIAEIHTLRNKSIEELDRAKAEAERLLRDAKSVAQARVEEASAGIDKARALNDDRSSKLDEREASLRSESERFDADRTVSQERLDKGLRELKTRMDQLSKRESEVDAVKADVEQREADVRRRLDAILSGAA